ncbi:Exonuclease V [Dillenia turbinata]|uniref:Exonuclease V n=1 Tax=Dillenia turbinata TaxID=194707 RepID=A0AAN8VCL5_9MAGN
MVGVADEVRMPLTGTVRNPLPVDTKTSAQATLPSEPQYRNGTIKLMCYKHLWDSLAAEKFPSSLFFDFYSLNPQHILLKEIRDSTAKSGFPAKTLDDLVRYFRNTCSMLPPANEKLLLRYELQEDNSLSGEEEFNFDLVWLKSRIQSSLEFWKGEREATYTPQEEQWKCSHCKFASVCPSNTNTNSASPQR